MQEGGAGQKSPLRPAPRPLPPLPARPGALVSVSAKLPDNVAGLRSLHPPDALQVLERARPPPVARASRGLPVPAFPEDVRTQTLSSSFRPWELPRPRP